MQRSIDSCIGKDRFFLYDFPCNDIHPDCIQRNHQGRKRKKITVRIFCYRLYTTLSAYSIDISSISINTFLSIDAFSSVSSSPILSEMAAINSFSFTFLHLQPFPFRPSWRPLQVHTLCLIPFGPFSVRLVIGSPHSPQNSFPYRKCGLPPILPTAAVTAFF